ncbi:MAG TPA: alpha/beta-hydrolase family protein [Pseudomonadales bacterium]
MVSSDRPRRLQHQGRSFAASSSSSGAAFALLFWWQSLTPTLIPRSWASQLIIGATCLAAGYVIGVLAGRWLRIPTRALRTFGHRSSGDAIRRHGRIILAAAWLIGVPLGSALWMGWQNEQRAFMGMPFIVPSDAVLMGALTPPAGALVILIGIVIARAVGAISRFIQRQVPGRPPVAIIALFVVVSGIVLGRTVLLRSGSAVAYSVYAPLNDETSEGTRAPDSPSVSGSDASFVAWDTLGLQGRDFVASVTTAQELAMFHGREAAVTEPVRAYVGVRSAASTEERAALAVRELERAGGFERKLLVVWVPTGSGWMIPEAAAALELLHRGDTAIVAIQYSFLPSLIGVFLDAGLANEAGRTLFDAVRARWSQLPRDRRPKLLLFGKSLGTAGVEAPFVGRDASESVANLVAGIDGALIVGPKHSNPIHAQITREREPASPAWQPVFARGRSVRFLSRDPNPPALGGDWPAPRIVYLQHPSDPVTFWSLDVLWRRPDWLDEPRGYDVPERLRWFPIVSGVQAVGDLLDQLAPPPGFGHVYSTDYVDGWVSVARPENWSTADTERLERLIAGMAGGESEP